MQIGILQAGHVPEALVAEHGDYDQIFPQFLAGRGLTFANYAVVDGQFPPSPEAAEGWLITGSRHGAYDDLPWIPPLEELTRQIYASGRPLVGVCFGHQLIAQALGGRVEKFSGGWAVGRHSYDFEGIGEVALNAWHQDQVTELPEGATVIAQNNFCAYPALAYGDRALTVQPHPEIRTGYLQGLLDVRAPGIVPQPLIDAARADLDAPIHANTLAEMIDRFFRRAPA